MNPLCNVRLLGGLQVARADRTITRFRTHKTAALLAYLAYFRQQSHPREVLTELLWPGAAPRAGRASLSMALSSLRHPLEPPGTPAGAVIVADRLAVGLLPESLTTDVAGFEAALQRAQEAADPTEQASFLSRAVDLYAGELLPGHYEEWVLTEQRRLAERFFLAVGQLTGWLERAGERERALSYARRAAALDPLCEEARRAWRCGASWASSAHWASSRRSQRRKNRPGGRRGSSGRRRRCGRPSAMPWSLPSAPA